MILLLNHVGDPGKYELGCSEDTATELYWDAEGRSGIK